MQTTTETAESVNVGKSNEVSPEEQAVLIVERKVDTKLDNGYSITIEEASKKPANPSLDFTDIPSAFTPAKPNTSISDKKRRQLMEDNKAIVQRKLDGMCHFGVRHEDGVSILSRGKLEQKADNFPTIARSLMKLPPGTILNGEICFVDKDDFKNVSRICRNKNFVKALEIQQDVGFLTYVVFDVLYWNGVNITDLPYADRREHYLEWEKVASPSRMPFAESLEPFHSYERLFGENNLANELGWEGYVVWDKTETTQVSFDGKAARKNCYKWKPTHTEDVWADFPVNGKGKNENCLGAVTGFQYHNGVLMEVGSVGGGFTQEERVSLWEARETVFPCAMEVECAERNPSMALRFPVFKRLRPDKTQEECVVQLLPRGGDDGKD